MDVETIAKPDISRAQASRIPFPEKLSLVAILLLFFFAAVHSARLRPFWFDELSTLFMTSTPTIHVMFRAIPTDGNPPLYFLLARPFLYVPIKTELALRFPAILGYLIASFTVYGFVRRDTSRIFAFLSMSMFLSCSFRIYAIEARAYSLLLAFTGLAILCWQSYCRSGKRSALAGISLSIVGAIFTHQYGAIYSMLPLIAGETVRALRRRVIDPRVLYALAIPAPALLLTYPVMLHAQRTLLSAIRSCPVFFAHPRWIDLKDYALMVPPILLLPILLSFFALLLKLAVSKHRGEESIANIPPEDFAVASTLSLFLPIMLIATHFGTNFFQHRYGIGSALGISVLAGLLLARLHWRHIASLAWAGVAYSLSMGLAGLWMASTSASANPWSDPILQAGDPHEAIVVASALVYPPMWWYGNTLRGRLHYLEDLSYARQHSDLVPEYSLALEHDYTPMQMEEYHTFLGVHRHFLLYCYGESRLEWIKVRLLNEGWHLTLLRSAKQKLPDDLNPSYRELFEVSR